MSHEDQKLTLDTILAAARNIEASSSRMINLFENPIRTFGGLKIYEAPELPVLQLRPDFEWCTDKFREEMNLWLLHMFGTRSVVPKGTAYVFYDRIAVMRPESIVALTNLI